MFKVEGTNITMSRGDTGAMRITARATLIETQTPYTFGERDRALFSIKSSNGSVVKQKAYPIVNNIFAVYFYNADTDKLSPGNYSWDVRYVINPYYEDDPPEGTYPAYSSLTFPVAKNTKCMHEGTYYISNQAITTSEEWTPAHWDFVDYRIPVDGDQVITPNTPMGMNLLSVVGEI